MAVVSQHCSTSSTLIYHKTSNKRASVYLHKCLKPRHLLEARHLLETQRLLKTFVRSSPTKTPTSVIIVNGNRNRTENNLLQFSEEIHVSSRQTERADCSSSIDVWCQQLHWRSAGTAHHHTLLSQTISCGWCSCLLGSQKIFLQAASTTCWRPPDCPSGQREVLLTSC